MAGKIADTLNDVIEQNERMARELERLSRVVGKEGKIAQRANPGGFDGSWGTAIESVNSLIDDLVQPTSEMARVIGAVAKGDLSQTMSLELDGRPLQGEFLRTAKTVNTMVDQLALVRVRGDARGPRGRHRGEARRPGGGEGCRGHLEGPDRQRELDGEQPHRRRCATSPR